MKSRKILLRALSPQIAAAGYCSELQTCLHTIPTEYLRTMRLQSACKLLMETDTAGPADGAARKIVKSVNGGCILPRGAVQ